MALRFLGTRLSSGCPANSSPASPPRSEPPELIPFGEVAHVFTTLKHTAWRLETYRRLRHGPRQRGVGPPASR